MDEELEPVETAEPELEPEPETLTPSDPNIPTFNHRFRALD